MTTTNDNYLECLPDDISKYIMHIVKSVPDKDELMLSVMDEVSGIDHEGYMLDEDQLDDELTFDEFKGSGVVSNIINKLVDAWSDDELHNTFNYHFRNLVEAERFIKKDEYDMEYWGGDDYVYGHTDINVKRKSMRLLVFNTFVERYEIVFDKENAVREWVRDDDDGEPVYEYSCYTTVAVR
tara:strand:- start:65 stop:610 length:546 start_codon:yes stop_codon:yes gene_type:complete